MKINFLRNMVKSGNFGLFLSAVILFAILSIFSGSFLTQYNIYTISRTLSLFAFIGLSQAIALVISHMNLSVGAIGGLCTITAGYFMEVLGYNPWIAALLAIMVGIACGAINGVIIAKIGINSFVVTLATMFIYTGINYGFTQGYSFLKLPESVIIVGRGNFLGIPLLLIITIIALVIVFLFYKYTLIGRRSIAIGQNIEAAKLSGINIPITFIFNHTLSGFVAAIGALFFISKMGSASPMIGKDWLIISFAVAVIGGTALKGGKITALGLFIASAIMIMIKNGLVLLEINVYWAQAFLGSLIILAIGVDRLRTLYSQRRI